MPLALSNERSSPANNPAGVGPVDAPAQPSAEANGWDYCPNCSARLINHGCRYRCPDGHYVMSGSDFD